MTDTDRLQRLARDHAPADVLSRATEVVAATADLVVRFRHSVVASSSPLTAGGRDEIVSYLLDPAGDRQRVEEFRTLLGDMLRFPLTVLPGGLPRERAHPSR